MERAVGRIVEVRGVKVRAELYRLFPPYIATKGCVYIAPRINTFVKTKVGLDEIICQVTGEYYDEQNRGQFTGYYLELTVKGYFQGNRFVQGLRLLPMVAANIELLDINEFKRINECSDDESFPIGTDLFDINQEYYLSYNAIIPTHIGIFGNTGSGKSNTLGRLLHEYSHVLLKQKNSKMIIFDINNEYGNNAICEESEKMVYNLTTKSRMGDRIPFNYSELQEDEWCILLNATEATQRPVIKTAFHDVRTPKDYSVIIKNMINMGQHQLVKSIQYNLSDYIKGMEQLKWHSKSEAFYFTYGSTPVFSGQEFDDLLDQISIEIPSGKLDEFLFRLYFATAVHIGYGTQYEFISPLLRRAEKLIADFHKVFEDTKTDLFSEKNIAVIQLANVNKDMMELIPAVITSRLFRYQVENKHGDKVVNIVNIVIDEAHNLLYADSADNRHSKITMEAFEKAVKEGRKFGLYLWISSQRPSDISQDIISQMHNYFIHKLVNPYDLGRIRKAVAFLDENSMDALTVLGPGECIVSGTSVSMPCFIRIKQLNDRYRPKSENVKIFGKDGIFEEMGKC